MTAEPEPPRWHSRLDTFRRAVDNLTVAVEQFRKRPFTVIEKAGLVQLYEIAWELGWKLQADYLRAMGHQLQLVGPRPVIRAAFEAGLIENGQGWIDAPSSATNCHTYTIPSAPTRLWKRSPTAICRS